MVDSETELVESAAPRSLSPITDEFLKAYEEFRREDVSGDPEPTVKVSQVLGSAAFVYEKIRNALEYRDEHLIRRSAIERILKRRIGKSDRFEGVAEALTRELIWARYLENDSITRSTVDRVDQIIGKYLYLRQRALNGDSSGGSGTDGRRQKSSYAEWSNWLLSIASCEIDKQFIAFDDSEVLVKLMYKWMKQNFRWTNEKINQGDKDIQLYIAIHRALLKSDQAILRYCLFNLYYPGWNQSNQSRLAQVAEEIYPLKETIEKHLKSRVGIQLYRYVNRYTAPFLILQSLVEEDPTGARQKLVQPERFEAAVHEVSNRRYAGISKKLRRGVIRSISYVLVTKMVVALVLEFPYDLFIVHELKLGPLIANVIFPPTLMFFVGASIRAPGEDNTKRIFQRLKNIVYGGRSSAPVSFSLGPIKRAGLLSVIFAFLYMVFFFISFGGIIALLSRFGFNLASGTLFIFFLCVVTFFGFRIRRMARELSVRDASEGLISHLVNVLSLPFLNTGAWLSAGFSQINIFTYIMDFLIEAPFKTIIEVTEQWTAFMRQKKEELIETPTP